MSVDLVIKSFSRDYQRLEFLLASIKRYFKGYNLLHLFLDDEPGVDDFIASVTPLDNWLVKRVSHLSSDPYILQQLYKLNAYEFSDADYLLPLDSDMIFFKECSVDAWFYQGKPFIPYGAWSDPSKFPPNSLLASVISMGIPVKHGIGFYIDIILEDPAFFGVEIRSYDGNELAFNYKASEYSLFRNNPHSIWLASINPVTEAPIDSMRQHYVFSREGLATVKAKIQEIAGSDLDTAVFDTNVFPVFSEYQVYGNVVNNATDYAGHFLLSDSVSRDAIEQIPLIKCNTREMSAYEAYGQILEGKLARYGTRLEALQALRQERNEVNPSEEWH